MYNLFVTSDIGYWEQNRDYEFERDRVSEYLDNNIADEYRENLSKRQDLPCLFSYERFEGYGRVGRLQSVREDAWRIAIKYQLDDAFPPIPIFSKDAYLRFGCSGLECYTTHWAVKNIDLYKVVAEIYGEKIRDANPSPVSASDMEQIWGSDNAGHPRLFLSHKAKYRAEISKLAKNLNANGISTFVAHHDIQPAREWRSEILNALNTMTHFVAFLTDGFHESRWTNQEVGYAFGLRKPRLFVNLEKVDPGGLANAEQALEANWDNAAEKIENWLASG